MATGPELLLKQTHGLIEERRGLLRESAALLVQLRAQPAKRASSARKLLPVRLDATPLDNSVRGEKTMPAKLRFRGITCFKMQTWVYSGEFPECFPPKENSRECSTTLKYKALPTCPSLR